MTELTAIAVALSPIVADLIASVLADRAPIAIAARFDTREAAADWLGAHAVDLVVAGARADAADEIAAGFLVLAPDATVLVLSDEGRLARISAVGASPVTLVDSSTDKLAEAVLAPIRQRAAAKRR